MKNIGIRSVIILFALLIAVIFIARKPIEHFFDLTDPLDYKSYLVEMVDDTGYRIKMKKYPEKIISLHPAHTINMFEMGLGKEILGVHKADVLPLDAIDKLHFSYEGDSGEILKEKPDLILITPEIERENKEFVNQLRRSGVNVFSLYPKDFEDMERYILTLGKLTGKKRTSEIYYKKILEGINSLEKTKLDIENKKLVYYEISEIKGLASTKGSIQDIALELCNSDLFTPDFIEVFEMAGKTDYLSLPEIGENIDVIFSEDGGTESGGSKHSIIIREGYEKIKAVNANNVYELDFRFISLPTIKLLEGVKELRRFLYPEIYGQIEFDSSESLLTKEGFAEYLVLKNRMLRFLPNKSYFDDLERGHYYGSYEDVTTDYPYFDVIETVVNAGYLKGRFDEEGIEWFDPGKEVTREEFALGVYLAFDLDESVDFVEIMDIEESEQKRIIERLVALKIMELDEENNFLPKDYIEIEDAIKALNRIEVIIND